MYGVRIGTVKKIPWSTTVSETQPPPGGSDITNISLKWPRTAKVGQEYDWSVSYEVTGNGFPNGVLIQVYNDQSSPDAIYVLTDAGWQPVNPGETANVTVYPGGPGTYTVPSKVKFASKGNYMGQVILVGQS